ncbi:MAG: transporter ATP-binding protein [Actinomycetia bacterium]|nr:transporter ATP-binding protein [Actinomycetes bacterium]
MGLAEASATLPDVLQVGGVSVALGGRKILDDVSFTIGAGEFTGLIGPNGAGKTTLLRVILGLQRATAGTVAVLGQPRSRRNPSIGYVPQKVLLDSDLPMRARDLVALGMDGHRFGMPLPSRQRSEAVREMLHAVDADRFADARVGNLSGGEQQRVLIAHALISRPRLLLLDEPLANLDLRSGQEIISLLARIATSQHVAVLLSAHEMNPLLPVMDRVVYLAAGRAASGPADQVIQADVLSKLYGHHVDVLHVHGRVLVVAGTEDGEGADLTADHALEAG